MSTRKKLTFFALATAIALASLQSPSLAMSGGQGAPAPIGAPAPAPIGIPQRGALPGAHIGGGAGGLPHGGGIGPLPAPHVGGGAAPAFPSLGRGPVGAPRFTAPIAPHLAAPSAPTVANFPHHASGLSAPPRFPYPLLHPVGAPTGAFSPHPNPTGVAGMPERHGYWRHHGNLRFLWYGGLFSWTGNASCPYPNDACNQCIAVYDGEGNVAGWQVRTYC